MEADSRRLRPIRAAGLFGIHFGSFPTPPTAKNPSKPAGFPGNDWLEAGVGIERLLPIIYG